MKFFNKENLEEKEKLRKKAKEKRLLEKELNDRKVNKLIKFSYLRVIRVILWSLILVLILRGIISIYKPNTQNTLNANNKILEKLDEENTIKVRLFSFAEAFAREYYTRYPINKEDFKNRILRYTKEQLANDMNNDSYSEIISVSAFSFEKYSDNQYNVSVCARVKQFIVKGGQENVPEDKKAYDQHVITENIKIPIYVDENGSMSIEDLPMIVSGQDKSEIQTEEYKGEGETNQEVIDKINNSLNEFFKAYYGGEQTQLDFLLEKQGIIKVATGESRFEKMNINKIYKLNENEHLIVIELNLKSFNNDVKQRVNVITTKNGDKYLIKKLDNRISNLNIE